MTSLEDKIYSEAQNDHEYIVALRRYFHAHPELPKQEFHTAEKIEEELHKIGLETKRVGETGVYAEIHGEKEGNKTIVLRADIDALPITEEHICEYTSTNPGVMHACGHDAHAAGLIGAARLLVKNKNQFGGTVRLTFQQAEEIGYGARVFVNEGYLDGANRTFGIHMASNISAGSVVLMPGPNNASVDWFRINVHGLAAHVSTPEKGIDAAYIASQIVISLQAIVTRRTSPMDNALIGIGKITAGTAYNIVAQEAQIEGTIRVFTPEIRKFIKEQIEKVSTLVAETYGGTVDFEWNDNTSPLINDLKATEEVQSVAKRVFGEDKVITQREPSLGGDDFAEYILKVPGCYGFVGSGNKEVPETTVAHHNSHFDIDEKALLVASALYAEYAVDYLNNTIE